MQGYYECPPLQKPYRTKSARENPHSTMAILGALSRLRMEISHVESAHERICIANPQDMLPGIAHLLQLMVRLLGLMQPTKHLIQDKVESGMVIERCHGSSSLISSKRYWRSSLKIPIPWNGFKAGYPWNTVSSRVIFTVSETDVQSQITSKTPHYGHVLPIHWSYTAFGMDVALLLRPSLHLTRRGVQLS